jgi:hypothetical protein
VILERKNDRVMIEIAVTKMTDLFYSLLEIDRGTK